MHANAETRTHSHPDTQTDTETLEHAKTRRRADTRGDAPDADLGKSREFQGEQSWSEGVFA